MNCRKEVLYMLALLPLGVWATSPVDTDTGKQVAVASVLQQAERSLSGVVTDAQGEPIIGATVVVKGTSVATVTDVDGRFKLSSVSPNAVITVSYLGYKPQNIAVGGKSTLNVVLKEDVATLNEVVAIGYGTQKKANLTGAVTSVDVNKSLSSRPIADIGRGLQGVVPGMNVTVPSGEIGSDPLIKIRGQVGSISGNNKPLILLDNVEIPSIQMVNPNDVQSISVLKDAASSSIYGAKAAFGVILITTKTGADKDRFEVSYSNNFSWQHLAKPIEMGGVDGLRYTLDAHRNRQETSAAGGFWRIDEASLEKAIEWEQKYGDKVAYNDPVLYGRDWYFDGKEKFGYRTYNGVKAMVRDWSPTMSHNLSVAGKSGKTAYNIGLGYLNQTGMIKPAKHDDFRRYNASINLTSEINKFVTIRMGSMYSDRNKRYPGVGTTLADPWLYLYRWSSLMPMGVKEGDTELRDPIYEMRASNTDNLQHKYYNVNLGVTLNFTKDWDLKADYTYDRQTEERNSSVVQYRAGLTWYGGVPWTADGYPVYVDEEGRITDTGGIVGYKFPVQEYYNQNSVSSIRYYNRSTDNNTFNLYTTYRLRLGKNQEHSLKWMLGMNRVANQWNSHTGRKTNLIEQSNPQFDLATGEQFVEGQKNWESQLGYFGRFNYSFADRYLFEANLRRDGSSKFPEHLRWQWFPSFSAGWVVTGEPFMKFAEKVVSFAKLRASWGSIGDQSVANTLYRSVLSSGLTTWLAGNGSRRPSYGTPTLVDNAISWQRIETLNLGLDMRFLNNELGFTFEWYERNTKDMIVGGESLPLTLGTKAPKGNYGHLRTRGWEVALDYQHRFANGLGVNAMLSVADATTMTVKGADHLIPWENRSLDESFSTGRRYGDIYGYVTDRLYQKDDFVYGEDGKIQTVNVIYRGTLRKTYQQTAEHPVYQVHYENSDKIIFAPGDVKFKDLDGDGYITPGTSTNGNPGDLTVIGNSTPRYEYSFRLGLDYKGFDFSVYFQGVGRRKIWGGGQLAIPGFNAKEGAMPKTFATDYWREDRTDAFYPRAWDLGGNNTGFGMQVQSKYLLNMAYLRMKNVTVGYTLPKNLLSKVYITNARCYLSLENFLTFDNLRGLPIDPEAVSGYSMFSSSYNMGRTGTGTPVFKSLSLGVQLSF
ncbi:MAG: TonB-dependent receptor [Prevotella sp.]|nr:TonB-dependent receptor [Prevotella sp.]